mgnify:FL=1
MKFVQICKLYGGKPICTYSEIRLNQTDHLRARQNVRFRGNSGLKGLYMKDFVNLGPHAMFGLKQIPVWRDSSLEEFHCIYEA